MEEPLHKVFGAIIIIGLIIGIITPLYLIIVNDPGTAIIPFNDLLKIMNLTHRINFRGGSLIGEKTIDVSNWTSLDLDVEAVSGIISIETSPDINKVYIRIYSSGSNIQIGKYMIEENTASNKLRVTISDSNIGLHITIPSDKPVSINSKISGGLAKLQLDSENIDKVNISVTGGLVWISFSRANPSIIHIKTSGGAVYTSIKYLGRTKYSKLLLECKGGLLNAKIILKDNISINLTTHTQGGYAHITLNGKEIDSYIDKGYGSSDSNIEIIVKTTGGFTDVGIER